MIQERIAEIQQKQEFLSLEEEKLSALALRVKVTIWTGSYTREELLERLVGWSEDQLDFILWRLLQAKQVKKIARDRFRLTYEGRRS